MTASSINEKRGKKSVRSVLEENTARLMATPGVVGVAESSDTAGQPCIVVYVSRHNPRLASQIPEKLDGYPVVITESGEFLPMLSPANMGHQAD